MSQWVECANCSGDGYLEHDCGEDSCCCLEADTEICTICEGEGGWTPHIVEEPRRVVLEAAGQQRLPNIEEKA